MKPWGAILTIGILLVPAAAEIEFSTSTQVAPADADVAADATDPYTREWLTTTTPGLCGAGSGPYKSNITRVHQAFNSTRVSTAAECCIFCRGQPARRCRTWTFHSATSQCAVSDVVGEPRAESGAVSGVTGENHGTSQPLPDAVSPLGFKPSFVFVLTDDQDRILGKDGYDSLGSVAATPTIQKRILGEGAVVENFYVNTPICCPSRTEFFTGRYFHNVGPPNDPGSCMHADTSLTVRNGTGMFAVMKQAGYNVGVFGKVTNDQSKILGEAVQQQSVDFIDSPIDYNNYDGLTYYRYDVRNGTAASTETLSKTKPIFGTTYQTTQIGNRTLRWLDGAIAEAKREGGRPFFAYVGPHAPHFPAEPAPWYEHAFDDVDAPVTPNYNYSCAKKAQHVRQNPPLTARVKCWENQHFRNRWSSLLSVDDVVEAVYDLLEQRNVLSTTYVIYSSDHGYKQGQWRIGTSKQHPYETDIRVPFFIRGPHIRAGSNFTRQISGNIDLMPTMLELAAGSAYVDAIGMDGRSMASFLTGGAVQSTTRRAEKPWRDHFLNEYLSVGTYYNDHSVTWQDGNSTTARCGGNMPRAPTASPPAQCVESAGVGDGNCYFVDSTHSNSWRQLRIVNASMNWNYIEYDPSWKFKSSDPTGAGLQHYELYDVARDPYQLVNIYDTTPADIRTALHAQLSSYYRCAGATCP